MEEFIGIIKLFFEYVRFKNQVGFYYWFMSWQYFIYKLESAPLEHGREIGFPKIAWRRMRSHSCLLRNGRKAAAAGTIPLGVFGPPGSLLCSLFFFFFFFLIKAVLLMDFFHFKVYFDYMVFNISDSILVWSVWGQLQALLSNQYPTNNFI